MGGAGFPLKLKGVAEFINAVIDSSKSTLMLALSRYNTIRSSLRI